MTLSYRTMFASNALLVGFRVKTLFKENVSFSCLINIYGGHTKLMHYFITSVLSHMYVEKIPWVILVYEGSAC